MQLPITLHVLLSLYLLVNIILLVMSVFGIHQLSFSFGKNKVADVVHPDDEVEEYSQDLSTSEKDRMDRIRRDENMQDRLRKIKEELDMKHGKLRKGTIATEEHPLVKNLPHSAVNAYGSPDKEEVAE